LAVVAVLACGRDVREGLTADSAVLQGGDTLPTPAADSSATPVDSTQSDSAQSDSLGPAAPTLVLLTDSAAGDVLYRRKGKCLSCHGLGGTGIAGLGANLQDGEWLHGDGSIAFIQRTIVDGVARPKLSAAVMPAFGTTLGPDEIYRIAAYVYTLSHPGAAVADTTRVPIDTIPPVDTPPPFPSRAALPPMIASSPPS
jgi:mono/diheme cytochrome c family protein